MAIKVVPNQKNSKFLHFLNAYICLDLGQEESQKVWKMLVIKLVALLRSVVLSGYVRVKQAMVKVDGDDTPPFFGLGGFQIIILMSFVSKNFFLRPYSAVHRPKCQI